MYLFTVMSVAYRDKDTGVGLIWYDKNIGLDLNISSNKIFISRVELKSKSLRISFVGISHSSLLSSGDVLQYW